MCGFAGFYTSDLTTSALLEDMTRAIAHRGPDDEKLYGFSGSGKEKLWRRREESPFPIHLGLGFRRLSIIDLSDQGSQPMATEDGRYHICFNGEIYNYIELRDELRSRVRSQSDTEVLLRLLAEKGKDALPRLNGIFAFALWDRETKTLTLARDNFGIKPLYYFKDERGVFFGSEIRSLLCARLGAPRLNRPLLQRYLLNNWVADPDTLFEGIFKLEPGHHLTIGPNLELKNEAYWDLSLRPMPGRTLETSVGDLNAALDRVVERQLRSDVPVAFFLSGGVDSSLLAAHAMRVQKAPPTTYTVGFKWNQNRHDMLDIESARLMAKEFGFQHNEILLEPSIVSLLPKVVEVLEEPIADAAAICSYLICEAAASRFKVLISGQGGDELFGGYPVFRAGAAAYYAQKLPTSLLQLGKSASDRLPYALAGHRLQVVHRLKKLARSALMPWPEPFCWLRSPFAPDAMEALLAPGVAETQLSPWGKQLELYERVKDLDPIHQLLYLDTKTYLPSLNLAYTDKTSMHHSMEVRVPLLDLEISNLISSIPASLKVGAREDKVLLKRLAELTLPKAVVHRKKAGFGLPLKDWFLKDLQPMARDLLSEERLKRQGLFNAPVVTRWLDEHQKLKADHGPKIFSLMTLQLWLERFNVAI
jgi:asparagine synthase (glutamine-hydrolysing)